MPIKTGLNSEKQAVFNLIIEVKTLEKEKGGGWWLLTPRGRILPHLRAYNCKIDLTALKAEGNPDVPKSKEPDPPNTKPCKTIRKKQWVILTGAFLLQGTEAPICWHDQSFRVWAGSRFWDVVERLLKVTCLSDLTRCSYSVGAQMILPGETQTVSKVITELWRW